MKTVLVFGGNGFIGSETVRQLKVFCKDEVDIVVVNRGKSWDWDTLQTVKPIVTHVTYDRSKPPEEFPELQACIDQHKKFDVVIDFSAYSSDTLERTMNILHNKVGVYVFISSDSIYEVTGKHHDGPTREEDDVLAQNKSAKKRAKKVDKYGYKKLKAEKKLKDMCSNCNCDYVILRLADVIGAYDSTDRWWQYQIWLQTCALLNLKVIVKEELKNRDLSFVFVKDVASVVVKICSDKNFPVNEAYNLAFEKAITLEELFHLVAKALDINPVPIQYSSSSEVPWIYPSVEKGPIDISKAKCEFSYSPTAPSDAVTDIVSVYEQIHRDKHFTRERKDIAKDLMKDINDIYPGVSLKSTIYKVLNLGT